MDGGNWAQKYKGYDNPIITLATGTLEAVTLRWQGKSWSFDEGETKEESMRALWEAWIVNLATDEVDYIEAFVAKDADTARVRAVLSSEWAIIAGELDSFEIVLRRIADLPPR